MGDEHFQIKNDDPQIMVCVTYMIQNDEPVKE